MKSLHESDKRLLLWLQEGELTTGELSTALKVSGRTIWTHASRLVDRGLIEKPHNGLHRLTSHGRAYIEEQILNVRIDFDKVGKVINKLPTEHHKALLRLLLSAIVAKRHLFDTYDQGWPSFIVGGPTKSMKTAMAMLICKLFGWESGVYIKHVQTSAKKELIGRRYQDSPGHYGFTPSPYFGYPFICLDELDKAEGTLRKQALFYLQGTRATLIEGESVENYPIPLVTLNTDSAEGFELLDSYQRRAVVFNTSPLRGELQDVDLVAEKIFSSKIPRLVLDTLVPLKHALSEKETHRLRKLLKANLNEKGWSLSDLRPLKLLVRGRGAFTTNIEEAIYQTVNDYLLCSETMDWTQKGWRTRIRPAWQKVRGKPADEQADKSAMEVPITDEPKLESRVEGIKEARFDKEDEAGELKEARAQILGGLSWLKNQTLKLKGKDAKCVTMSVRARLNHDIDHVKAIAIVPLSWPAIKHYEERMQVTVPYVKKLTQLWEEVQDQKKQRKEQKKELKDRERHKNKSLKALYYYRNKQPHTPPAKVLEMLITRKYVYPKERKTEKQELMDPIGGMIDYTQYFFSPYRWEKVCSVKDLQRPAGRSHRPDPSLLGACNMGVPEEADFFSSRRDSRPLDSNIAEIRERLKRKDSSIKTQGNDVLVRKRKENSNLGYRTVIYTKKVYVADDSVGGGEFTAEQINWWGKPAVQRILTKRIEIVKAEREEIRGQLRELNDPDNLPRLSQSSELPSIGF